MDSQTPAVTLLGFTRAHAARAVKWLSARSILSFYNSKEGSLCAFETKHGRDWTYRALLDAQRETRK